MYVFMYVCMCVCVCVCVYVCIYVLFVNILICHKSFKWRNVMQHDVTWCNNTNTAVRTISTYFLVLLLWQIDRIDQHTRHLKSTEDMKSSSKEGFQSRNEAKNLFLFCSIMINGLWFVGLEGVYIWLDIRKLWGTLSISKRPYRRIKWSMCMHIRNKK